MATATATRSKSKVKIQPIDDRVVVEQVEAEEKTAGGIVLPDSAREKPQRGKVIATGPGKLLDSGERGTMSVKVGDEVFYGKYAGTEIEIDGNEVVILRESDILAIIE
jgi:chaperonin GroES